jgi:uncharacterized protein YbaP (TraB family)
MLSAQPFTKDGFDPKSGADMVLTSQADQDHKTMRTFETLEQQIRFFADLPPQVEAAFLDQTIDEQSTADAEAKGMEAAWMSGELNQLGLLMVGEMKTKYPELYDALIRRRNRAFAEALAGEMTGSNVEMVNVGALHMVGEDGLPALLAARGFKVTRLQ